ncbi:unnamed protein product [Closterium sp. NIES-53]
MPPRCAAAPRHPLRLLHRLHHRPHRPLHHPCPPCPCYDLQLYLLSDSKDTVSLFDLASGAATAPPATADIARYSSPATASLGRLLLPYLFPELSAFTKVEDLVSHLRASDARYRAAVPTEFLIRNPPPMYITLYFMVTRLLDSLRSVSDHFISLDPTSLTVDLLEQHLLAGETSAVAVGAARGTPHPPFYEGCSPSPLAPSYASTAAADVSVPEDVRAASASAKRRSSKGKGGRGGGGGSGGGGGGSGSGGGGSSGGGGGGGAIGGSGGSGGGGGGSGGSGGSGGDGTGSGDHAGQTCGQLHTQHRCFSRLDDAWRAKFGDDVELPRWADLLRSRIAIFDLDFDAILSAMCALFVSAEGDCYRCVPPDPGIAAATLGASESGTLPGNAPAEALHTFMLDSGASRCFFCDSTTLTPPCGGYVLPSPLKPTPIRVRVSSKWGTRFCTAALQDAMVTTTTPGGSSLYTLANEPSQVAASAQVSASGQVATSCSCHLLSHQTLLCHHRLGHPSMPRLCGMHSRLLRAAPHSSFPPTTAPLQTLHMDVWGPARVSGQSRERYFLLVVNDYTWYTTVFPLRSKGQIIDVLIPWIRTVRLELRERFGQDLRVLLLHSNRGGEFSSSLLREFCRGEGILQSFMLLDSPQQNGIAERRIGLVMEVARTSMIHAAAPHFQWLFAVWYAAHQLNLWPRVSLPEISPTLRWTMRRCSGSGDLFYHPTSRRVFPSQDVTFDESVPYYRLFPYRSAPLPPPSLFLSPDPLPGPVHVQVAVDSGAARGAASGGAESEGAETGSGEPGGAEPRGAEPEGVEPGGSAGASPRLSPQQLREWFVRRTRLRSGAYGAGGAGAAGAGVTRGTVTTGPGGARTRGTGAAGAGGVEGAGAGDLTESGTTDTGGTGAGGAGVGGLGEGGAGVGGPSVAGAGAGGAGAVAPGGTVRPRPYFVPLLQQVLGTPPPAALTPPLLYPPLDPSLPPLQPASPLPTPSPYTEQSGGLTERREPASRPVSPVRTACRVPRSRPPPVPGTHAMAILAELLDFAAACRLDYATALVAESTSASPPSVGGECAPGTDVLEDRQEDFECLAAAVPRFASMLLAPEGDPDAPDIPTLRSYAVAITGPYSSQWQAAMDAKMASWKSTGTYLDEVPPPGANIVNGMWIFRVKRPPSSPPAFKACYVAKGFSQRQGVDYFQTFSPSTKMTTLRVLLHVTSYLMTCTRTDLAYPLSLLARYVAPGRHRKVHWDSAKRVLRYLCSTSGMGLVLGGRGQVVLTGHADASWVDDSATQRSSQGYTFSLGSGSVSWLSTCSSSVLSSSCEAESYAGAMAAQELRWLTYLLSDLGEQPRSPLVLYVDNKAMIALYQEHRLEHRTKHIALRYFLARELQQRGQFCLSYVATRANTADVFTKALPPGDHQRFVTVLGLVPTLPHLLTD